MAIRASWVLKRNVPEFGHIIDHKAIFEEYKSAVTIKVHLSVVRRSNNNQNYEPTPLRQIKDRTIILAGSPIEITPHLVLSYDLFVLKSYRYLMMDTEASSVLPEEENYQTNPNLKDDISFKNGCTLFAAICHTKLFELLQQYVPMYHASENSIFSFFSDKVHECSIYNE